MTTKDLGVWTAGDCVLVLIDYQKEMFEVIRSQTSADLVELTGDVGVAAAEKLAASGQGGR